MGPEGNVREMRPSKHDPRMPKASRLANCDNSTYQRDMCITESRCLAKAGHTTWAMSRSVYFQCWDSSKQGWLTE